MLAPRDFARVELAVLVLFVVSIGGCKPRAGGRVPRGGDLQSYLAALDSNESDLRAAGVAVPSTPPVAGAPAGASGEQELVPGDEAKRRTTSPSEPEAEPDADAVADGAFDDQPREEAAPAAPMNAPPRATGTRAADKERQREDNRCTRICGLAEMACELETRICELALEHPGERRYEDACERAQQQCDAAADACRTCS